MQRRLDIEQNGKTLYVKTTVMNSKGTRRVEVKYRIGGLETVYRGLDGDGFHSSVHWIAGGLLFDTVKLFEISVINTKNARRARLYVPLHILSLPGSAFWEPRLFSNGFKLFQNDPWRAPHFLSS